MALKITKAQIWTAKLQDKPGSLAAALDSLAAAGADLDCVIARRAPDKPGIGVVYLTPVTGRKAIAAADAAGVQPAKNMATLRVEGPNKPGIGAKMMRAIAGVGVNVRGVSAVAMGNKFVAFIGLDNPADADAAAKALKAADKPRRPARR